MRVPFTASLFLAAFSVPSTAQQTDTTNTDVAGPLGTPWAALDEDLDAVVLPLQSQDDSMPEIYGFLRSDLRYTTQDRESSELGDFRLWNANIFIAGTVGDSDVSYRFNYEAGNARPGGLEDAFLRFKLPGELTATLGQFKAPILRSGLVEDDRTLFFDHSFLGRIFEVRDQGIMLERRWDYLRGAIAVQDGIDGADTDAAFIGRLAFDVAGEGVPLVEGAYGAPKELSATVAASVLDDNSVSDGILLAFEAAVTYDRFASTFEIVTADDGFDDEDLFNTQDPRRLIGDATPWAFTASYLVTPQFEAGYRIDFLDTPTNNHIQTLGGNYYLDGHNLKWQGAFSIFERDGRDDHTLSLGLSVNF